MSETRCASCGHSESSHIPCTVLTGFWGCTECTLGSHSRCTYFVRPAAPSAGASLPPEIVAALDEYRDAVRSLAFAEAAQSVSSYLERSEDAARAALESEIASRLRASPGVDAGLREAAEPMLGRALDRVLAEVVELIDRNVVGARSPLADALIDYADIRFNGADPIIALRTALGSGVPASTEEA